MRAYTERYFEKPPPKPPELRAALDHALELFEKWQSAKWRDKDAAKAEYIKAEKIAETLQGKYEASFGPNVDPRWKLAE